MKLLRKGTKDPTLIGNYRPISLLSIFYKLASCCITQRIKPAVNRLIGRQQKAFITQEDAITMEEFARKFNIEKIEDDNVNN